ncbi:YddF family protein [Alkaliphilus hydrothermalis]|uniref:DUF1874 domain-containing protein n=1 Tax=Alkaliphilus hydrothermalis TaxID=1482730 RepID=A0ABS2NNP7_9FIRM|nr:YddF family protein [Alkaliphilus hydrothermalis]MBM7614481.1 hypothetical protein [Alkaliphilus hydrothermalis]
MKQDTSLPIVLFNGTIATTNGIYSIQDINVESAKKLMAEKGVISAIGHKATAEILTDILEQPIPMNRIEFHQQVGQIAIVLKLNIRPEEGVILSKEEVDKIGYCLKIMVRLE